MNPEYIYVDAKGIFVIEVKMISEYMTSVFIIYNGERHLLAECFSKIYGECGYDEVIYNEFGAIIVRTFDNKSKMACAFDATKNLYLDNVLEIQNFYDIFFDKQDCPVLKRRF